MQFAIWHARLFALHQTNTGRRVISIPQKNENLNVWCEVQFTVPINISRIDEFVLFGNFAISDKSLCTD